MRYYCVVLLTVILTMIFSAPVSAESDIIYKYRRTRDDVRYFTNIPPDPKSRTNSDHLLPTPKPIHKEIDAPNWPELKLAQPIDMEEFIKEYNRRKFIMELELMVVSIVVAVILAFVLGRITIARKTAKRFWDLELSIKGFKHEAMLMQREVEHNDKLYQREVEAFERLNGVNSDQLKQVHEKHLNILDSVNDFVKAIGDKPLVQKTVHVDGHFKDIN